MEWRQSKQGTMDGKKVVDVIAIRKNTTARTTIAKHRNTKTKQKENTKTAGRQHSACLRQILKRAPSFLPRPKEEEYWSDESILSFFFFFFFSGTPKDSVNGFRASSFFPRPEEEEEKYWSNGIILSFFLLLLLQQDDRRRSLQILSSSVQPEVLVAEDGLIDWAKTCKRGGEKREREKSASKVHNRKKQQTDLANVAARWWVRVRKKRNTLVLAHQLVCSVNSGITISTQSSFICTTNHWSHAFRTGITLYPHGLFCLQRKHTHSLFLSQIPQLFSPASSSLPFSPQATTRKLSCTWKTESENPKKQTNK